MTLKEMQGLDREFLTPAEVASVLGCDPQAIRLAARLHPDWLTFPAVRIGSRTKIPRIPFLRAMGCDG